MHVDQPEDSDPAAASPVPPTGPMLGRLRRNDKIIIAAAVAVAFVLCCGGTTVVGLLGDANKDKARTTVTSTTTGLASPSPVATAAPAPTSDAASTSSQPLPPSPTAVPSTPGPGATTALTVEDPGGDLTGGDGDRLPWVDLVRVTWQRTPSGATITYTTATTLPARLPDPWDMNYTGFYLDLWQGGRGITVAARLMGPEWHFDIAHSTGTAPFPMPLRVTGNTVSIDLPQRIETQATTVDLTRPVETSARTVGRLLQPDGIQLWGAEDSCFPPGGDNRGTW